MRKNIQRDEYIFSERQKGRTYKDIGQELGISVERVRQVCVQVSRDRRKQPVLKQCMAENGMIVSHHTFGKAEVVVYRPVLDEKERKKREDIIRQALVVYGKERVRRRMEEAAKANQNK